VQLIASKYFNRASNLIKTFNYHLSLFFSYTVAEMDYACDLARHDEMPDKCTVDTDEVVCGYLCDSARRTLH